MKQNPFIVKTSQNNNLIVEEHDNLNLTIQSIVVYKKSNFGIFCKVNDGDIGKSLKDFIGDEIQEINSPFYGEFDELSKFLQERNQKREEANKTIAGQITFGRTQGEWELGSELTLKLGKIQLVLSQWDLSLLVWLDAIHQAQGGSIVVSRNPIIQEAIVQAFEEAGLEIKTHW